MRNELITASLKIEGEIFKISRQLDKSADLNKYVKLKSKLEDKRIQYEQYQNVLKEMNKGRRG